MKPLHPLLTPFLIAATAARAQSPSIDVLEPTIPLGTAAHVSAYPLFPNPSDTFNHCLHWNFGEPNPVPDPRNYATHAQIDIGQSFPGPIAAHIYYRPGPKTITLHDYALNPDGSQGPLLRTAAATITVLPPNRHQFYVDSIKGNDTNPGTEQAPLKSADAAFSHLASNTEIDFASAQTFPFTNQINLGFTNAHLSHFNSGPAPILCKTTPGNFFSTWNAKDIAINGLTFTCSNQPQILGIFRGTNITFTDCNFANLAQAIQGSSDLNGIFIQRCEQLPPYNMSSRCEWIEGQNWVSAGNAYFNSTVESPSRMDSGTPNSPGGVNVSFTANRVGQLLSPTRPMAKAALTFRCGSNITEQNCLIVDAENSINTPGFPNTISNIDIRNNVLIGISQSDGDAKMCFYTGIKSAVMQMNQVFTQQGPAYTLTTLDPNPKLNDTALIFRNNTAVGWSPNSRLATINNPSGLIINSNNEATTKPTAPTLPTTMPTSPQFEH